MSSPIEFSDFTNVDLRVGQIIEVSPFPEARKAAYKLKIDFGSEIGIKQSSAQITALYTLGDLLHRDVIAIVNLQPRRIAGFKSEVLVLGLTNSSGQVVLLQPEREVPIGSKVH